MVGPQLQKDLFGILIRFPFHQVALSDDIAKMYCQVQLDDEDKAFAEKSKRHRTENIQIDKSDLWKSIIFVPLN